MLGIEGGHFYRAASSATSTPDALQGKRSLQRAVFSERSSASATTTRQDKTRQDKTRQDKTRQDKTRQQDKTRDSCIIEEESLL
jgi:hypothetical protein